VRAGPPHRRNDEIAGRDHAHRGADLYDLGEALVSQHEMVGAGGRRAELEATDLAIGAAHTDLDDAQPHVGGGGDDRRVVCDEPDRALAGKDSERPQRLLASHQANTFFTRGVSRVRLYASAAFFIASASVG
jgi:hypothetical protein